LRESYFSGAVQAAALMEETRKIVFRGGEGPIKWLHPILVNNCFQPVIKGGNSPAPPKIVAIRQPIAAKRGEMWQIEAYCGKLQQIAANWQ
jgi:hypothetical protein